MWTSLAFLYIEGDPLLIHTCVSQHPASSPPSASEVLL